MRLEFGIANSQIIILTNKTNLYGITVPGHPDGRCLTNTSCIHATLLPLYRNIRAVLFLCSYYFSCCWYCCCVVFSMAVDASMLRGIAGSHHETLQSFRVSLENVCEWISSLLAFCVAHRARDSLFLLL